jgi:putative FmdB family regulatory protein
MPRYDFRCADGHTFERARSIAERDEPQTCPTCEQPAVRLVGAPGIQFKGSGFYETDYKRRS